MGGGWERLLADAEPSLEVARDSAMRFRQGVRELVEDEVLPAWGTAFLADDAGAASRLRNAQMLAGALADLGEERWLAGAVARVARGDVRDGAAEGAAAFGQGRRESEANHFERAAQLFDQSRRAWARTESPLAGVAEYNLGLMLYQLRQLPRAQEIADRVIQQARRSHATSLAAHAGLLRGAVRLQRGDAEGALQDYAASLAEFERIGEHENAGNVANSAADTLRLIGQHQPGWQLLGKALGALPQLRSVRRRYVTLLNASLYAADDELPRAALLFRMRPSRRRRHAASPTRSLKGIQGARLFVSAPATPAPRCGI